MRDTTMARELFDSFATVLCGPAKVVLEVLQGEAALLAYLHKVKAESTPTEISNWLHISTSRVATMLGSLDKKGLITYRHDHVDRRRVYVALTESGVAVATEREESVIALFQQLLDDLGQEDAREYLRLTRRVARLSQEAQSQEAQPGPEAAG